MAAGGALRSGAGVESCCEPDRNMLAERSFVLDVSILQNVLTRFWIPECCSDR